MKKFNILSLLCLCLAFCGIMFIAGCNEVVEESETNDIAHTKGDLISIVVDSNSTNCLGKFVCSVCGETFVDSIEYADLNVPILNITGSLNGISKDKKVKVSVSYDASEEQSFSCDATLKLQGTSSLNYPKKNYNIQFYKTGTDYNKKQKLELFEGCGAESKYTLKANWVDFTQARNVVAGKLYNEVVHTGELNDEITALSNGGVVDGYPILMFQNGSFLGLYTLNIAKDNLFGMEEGETRQAALMASSDNWTNVDLNNQINLDDGNWTLEFCSTEDIDEIGTGWVVDSFNSFINFLNTSSVEEFVANAENYFSVNHTIDCLLYSELLCALDNTSKNIIYVTYDGIYWIESMYDMDGTFGNVWNGQSFYRDSESLDLHNKNKLWQRVYKNFYDRIVARYTELREGPLAISNIDNVFVDFFNQIPGFVYMADLARWGTIPNPDESSFSQIINWTIKRIVQLDDMYEVTIEEVAPLKIIIDTGPHAKVYVYRSQDLSLKGDLTGVAFARDGETGKISSAGEGECNFVVVLDNGYELDGNIDILGGYESVVNIAERNNSISLKITNITTDLTITISTKVRTN